MKAAASAQPGLLKHTEPWGGESVKLHNHRYQHISLTGRSPSNTSLSDINQPAGRLD